jgi:hypothetical protein
MKTKLIALVLIGAGALAVGVIRSASTIQKRDAPYKDRLKWYAKEAKNQGRQKVSVPAPLVEYLGGAGTITSEEAFSSSTVVIAHLISKQSYPRNDDIITWNKFAIDEVLSEAKELPCPGCLPLDPPSNLLPLQSGEFLISKTGGTVNIDGVEVEQNDRDFPDYEPDQKYLLLINLYPAGTARTIGGPVGVFRILQNDKVLPLRESEHRIRKDFKEKYGNSLEQLRKHLKRNNK